MQIYCKKLSSAAPGVGAEEEQERENLESAEEHIERKDNLREIAVNAEILCGADKLKAGADVVEAGATAEKLVPMEKPSTEMMAKLSTRMTQ